MDKYQVHNGKKFYQDNKKGYWISTTCPKIRAHVWVWEQYYNRKCPKGYHIHHRDGNKSNNSIENLELMERSRHLSLHMQSAERKEFASKNCDKIRHLTKAWHGSPEGLAWHKLHAIKCKFGKSDPVDYVCIQCSKEFKSSKLSNAKFCCNNCKSQWRRLSGKDDIELVCKKCGIKFVKNKYARNQTCGKGCKRNIREGKREQAITLRGLGYTYQQIADNLGMSRANVSDLVNNTTS
jgi:DNA-directed RNA polymerase subunit RPC12/RpoP